MEILLLKILFTLNFNMTPYKKWFRLFVFGLSFFAIFYIIQTFFFRNDVAWAREKFYSKLDQNYDVIFMGDSHCFTTFSPKVINEIIGINSYSLGVSEQNISQSYFELQQLLKSQKPIAIFLEENSVKTRIRYSLIGEQTVSPSTRVNGKLNSLYKNKFPLIINHAGWKTPEILFKNLNDFLHFFSARKTTGEDENGFHQLKDVIFPGDNIPKKKKEIEISIDSLPEENQYYFKQITSLCEENDVRLILIKSPLMGVESYQLDTFNYDIPYYDLNCVFR